MQNVLNKEVLENEYNALIMKREQEKQKVQEKYQSVIGHRRDQIKKAKETIVKIFSTVVKQAKVIQGIEAGKYSSGVVTMKLQEKPELPRPEDFPKLYAVLKDKQFMQNELKVISILRLFNRFIYVLWSILN